MVYKWCDTLRAKRCRFCVSPPNQKPTLHVMATSGKKNRQPHKSEPKFYTSTPFFFLLGAALLALIFFLWHQSNLDDVTTTETGQENGNFVGDIAVPEQTPPTRPMAIDELERIPDPDEDPADRRHPGADKVTGMEGQPSQQQSLDDFLSSTPSGEPVANDQIAGNEQPDLSKDQEESQDIPLSAMCTPSAEVVKEFFQYLDGQEYLNEFQIEPNSQIYFSALLQKLLDNPPIVSGETDDLFTVLQNTAHFFRIIGNENIRILKTILSNENQRFEEVLANFYRVVNEPLCAKNHFNLHIPDNALYEYAGFFLNTMGGRLYLFRRDSVSRMVISYYSVLLIDKANIAKANTHGIEIATSIDLLIDEMESTSKSLELRDNYLATLYILQEEYQ